VPKKMRYDTEEEDGNQKQQVSTPEMTSFRVDEEEEKGDEGKEISPQKHNATSKEASIFASTKKGSSLGRRGDPRMHKAVAARLTRPELTPFQALVIGGFKFPDHVNEVSIKYSDGPIYDSDNVLLSQRKNQLSRRLRHIRRRFQKGETRGQAASYFHDTKQFLGNQLHPFIPSEKTAMSLPVDNNGSAEVKNDSSSAHALLAPVSASSTTYSLSSVPNTCFSFPNQQMNTFQQQQQMQLLKDLANQQHLRDQLSMHNSAAQQQFLYNTSRGIDPSYFGGPFRSLAHNFTSPAGSSSIGSTQMFNNLANDIISNVSHLKETRIGQALSMFDTGREDMKRRALVAAGFNENQIDESLLEAMNGHLEYNLMQR